MRSLALFAAFFCVAPAIVVSPFVGALLWVWLALMNPQTLAGGAAKAFPFAVTVAAATLIAWLLSREPKRPPGNAVVVLLGLYIGWCTLTTAIALYPDGAWFLWSRFIKIQASNLVVLMLLTSRPRVEALVWAICLSLAYFVTRDGVFTLLTGGRYLTYGPDGTEIAGNNEFGLALLMLLPLLAYLAQGAAWRWLRIALWGELGLAVVTIFGTYSRGALTGLAALAALMLLGARRRFQAVLVVLVVAAAALQFFPYWSHRVESVDRGTGDSSFEGRLQAWTHGVRVALARPLTGGGMGTFSAPVFLEYSPDLPYRAAHSIYFQTLGEQGFVGLAIFLALMAAGLHNCLAVVRQARRHAELAGAARLARALALAIVGYATAGAFLSLANLDLYYMVLALTVGLRRCSDRVALGAAPEPLPPAATAPASA